jgi:TolB-like protein/serine/threonine protein kinase/Tfp pilus assembly protein PilF/class 3 adenylate cyclase/alpha-beta hydrolase superfamily lysophospholipase
MTSEHWQRIKALLESALERAPGERSAFLAAACAGDESLRKEVESFIISHEQAGGFIEEPAFEVMAESLVNKQTELVGQTLGHYRVLEQLGAGGMGEVYLAEDVRLGRKVALKMLPADLTAEDERVRRFQQEARAASALNHPNIITIYEIVEMDSRRFMATEFIDGETLFERLKGGPMKLDDALDVAVQVTSALCAAHQAGIVHRDIKPGNIMLRTDGIVKVLDFGLAMLTEQKDDGLEAATLVKTRQGTVMGTPHYMSPEQARGQKMDARTDVFSLGVVLYEMLTGRVPFGGQTMTDVLASILMLDPPSLSQSAPDAPKALQRIVHNALRKDREERYQTAGELLTDLKALKQELEFETRSRGFSSSGSRDGAAASANARPETRYAKSGEVNIAYQVVGSGPVDLVYVMGWVTNLDYFWEEPSYARFLNRLASFSRLILFDKRGTGLSDRVHESELPTLEQRMDDVRAVMDAVGSERASLLGVSEGGPMAALFAATYPERTSALVMYGSYAKRIWDPTYPWAPTPGERQKFFDLIRQGWGGEVDAAIMAPSRARDEQFKEWWATYLGRSASPGAALAFAKMNTQIDITNILPTIRVPTLIVHRAGDLDANVGGARHMARQIPGAKYVELPGDDHLPFVGNQEAILDEIEKFLDGIRHVPAFDRVLATVLCLNVIGSTGAAKLREHELRDSFLSLTKRELERFRGREVETSEHTVMAGFDGPARAIRAACSIRDSARRLGIEIKAGLHTGECDTINENLAGIAVEMSAQIAAKARAGEVLVSSTVKDLVAGAGIQFEDRRARPLKGVEGKWHLFAVVQDGESGAIKQAHKPPPKSSGRNKAIDSLAILPLENDSADPNMEYFSDGITESIINALSQLPRLRVVARSTVFRYKGLEVDPQEVGQQLGVRAVLTGRVRQAGDELMIAAELIDVRNDEHLWGEHYNRKLSSIFDVQEEIAKEISERLRLKLTGDEKKRLAKRHTANAEAYQLYLRGRYFWYKRTEEALRKSIDYFNQAIAEDPSYAAAYDGLSDSYALLALRGIIAPREGLLKAKAAARKALEIDDSLGEAYASLAHARLHDWDWSGLEEEFKRALELNPGHAIAYHWYSEYLMAMGRADESIAIVKQAQETDPISPVITSTLGFALLFARKYDRAIEQFQKALELDPNHFLSHYRLGHIYSLKGQHREALEAAQKSVALSGSSTETLAGLGQAYAAAGMSEETQKVLDELNESSKERYVSPYYVAKIYASLGEKEQAVAWLEKGYLERNPDFIELKVEPVLDVLRTDARFRDLLRRVGLAPAESFPAAQSSRTTLKSSWTGPSRKRTASKTIASLAILPLVNTGADPNMDYLSDGITESIINSLSQLPKLRVLARSTVFRYKGREVDPQQAGRELGVQAVLTGRVLQIGERLIIGTELVDVDDGSQLWGQQYQRAMADIFELQEEISGQISEALRLKVSGAQKKRLMKRLTKNTQAYELYLRGRFFFNKRTQEDANRGIECFQQALSLDPNFALAYTGLADCQILLGDVGVQAMPPKEAFLQGQESAARALEIGDALAEAHGTLGHVSMHLFDWPRAESELRRALDLNPNYAQAYLWQAYYLAFTGQFEDAIASINCALQLDPLALPVNTSAAELLYFAGRFDESIDQFHKSIELDARYSMAHLELARVYEHREIFDAAIDEFAKARELSQDSPESLASLAHCYAVSGAIGDAQTLLQQLTEISEHRYVSAYDLALIHSGLGQKEECFEWLNRAHEIHDGWMIYITVDPRWQSLRSDARFARIVQRVGLPVRQLAVQEAEAEPKLEPPPVESVNATSGRQTMTGTADRTIERKAAVPSTSESIAAGIKRHKTGVAAIAAVVVLMLAALVYSYVTAKRATIDSLAVLPFQNVSGDPNTEYLSDGIAESIIYSTSQLSDLKVIPRSSVFRYKGKEIDPQTAGRELGVNAIMTGTVVQRGDDLSISAELVDLRDNRVLWGRQYNRKMGDVLAVEEEIAREVSEKLRQQLTTEEKQHLARRYPENAEAYQLYLKGRYYWYKRTRDGYKKAIEEFDQAIQKDRSYALAYAGLADCYNVLSSYGIASPNESFPKGKAAALRAQEIDGSLAEARTSLAYIRYQYEWDFSGAESEYRKSIELDPNYATAHQWYAIELAGLGRMDEAIREITRAQEIDPTSLIANVNAGWIFYHARQYDRAIEQMRKSLEMDPNFARGHWAISEPLEQEHRYDEAIAELQKARQLDETPIMLALLSHVYAVSGKRDEARKILERLTELSKDTYVDPYFLAEIHTALGERDQALRDLENAYSQRSSWLVWLKVEPKFDALRSDPRYADLLKRIGLPQ